MRSSSRRLGLPSAALVLLLLGGCASHRGALLYKTGTEALDSGDSALAIARLKQAAELVPHASEIQNHLGLAYAASGRDRRALHAFQRAVELDCDNAAALENLAAAQARLMSQDL